MIVLDPYDLSDPYLRGTVPGRDPGFGSSDRDPVSDVRDPDPYLPRTRSRV